MGIIAPKKPNRASKIILTVLLLVLSPIVVIAVLLYLVWGATLYLAIWFTHQKLFIIFVYSDSPIWKDYVEKEILPQIQNRAVILNWSERSKWKSSLAVLGFRYFGGYRNFNPIALVFRPFHIVKTYRFFEAFKEFKHGKPKRVEALTKGLLIDLEL